MTETGSSSGPDGNVIETIQSLIVAFVLAMTFRGFVTEGFVIPTGSMAPTLLGRHTLVHSQMSGMTFAVGLDQADVNQLNVNRIADPMLGPAYPGSGFPAIKRLYGMGDRILVLKALYPFAEPRRFDVVVFKNPTDPLGEAANYIKRLIGLPNEQVWLADGDVFARPLDQSEFRIQRKPEHVQRAVWQPVYDSDFAPQRVNRPGQPRYDGPPWRGDASVWNFNALDGRSYVSVSEPAMLMWDHAHREINDWAPYNMLSDPVGTVPMSDLRVCAGVVASQPGLKMTLELEARSHLFQFIIDSSSTGAPQAIIRMRPVAATSSQSWVERQAPISLPSPGSVFNIECWHVDQALYLFINDKLVVEPLQYDWNALQRLQHATGSTGTQDVDFLVTQAPDHARLRWRFEGSTVTLHRVRLDRDLHYRHARLGQQRNGPYIDGDAFGTNPHSPQDHPGILGPDQFMMCGDNSQKSLDSRFWGRPHPLIASQIDESPFVVNRKLLLGKAWVVYFPAPYPITERGYSVVPDFGRLRFIR